MSALVDGSIKSTYSVSPLFAAFDVIPTTEANY
jgi:hypothetical protein